ncbi:pyridoxamine-phosphate oxidase PDX3 [Aspergillus fijiensis CBS 313.89]|uniref:pyridoxal 5'-phosphate synthase n=1 Tax=Aspergillus fijiensis CBS 313.89 TaxID=1448319 RepID=A0A8G1VWQ4_9EURO|nr:uncharacterized protein BO72DRAFT_460216 [Aspergillus fijiensis CBS 313.89]RAK75825.1 hypothetical protein BO72DRAFT_460216 [Aspergillus fijiensis CBS 313.89]
MNIDSPDGVRSPSAADPKHPKKLIFAPGDIETPPPPPTDKPLPPAAATPEASATANKQATQEESAALAAATASAASALRTETSTPTSATEQDLVAHAARAHQFVSNPPLTVSQLHPTNPLHQFHSWFRDPRLLPASAPETCTLATAALPSGRVSARVVYLKELDERGWTVYSNWGSREGKGRDVFGETDEEDDGPRPIPEPGAGAVDEDLQGEFGGGGGNRWAALTFLWSGLERQVRVEGLVEPLSREESELYWRTRERGSQIGAWASWQSKVLWRAEPETLLERRRKSLDPTLHQVPRNVEERDIDDGRAVLEERVREVERRFEGVKEIPLPPFWGGVRLVPESVEFWQGRKSRLHDRFRHTNRKMPDPSPDPTPKPTTTTTTTPGWILLALSSGAFAAFNGLFAKLTTDTQTTTFAASLLHLVGSTTTNPDDHPILMLAIRGICLALNILCNIIMWALFTRALTASPSTTKVSITNTSANFLVTAVLGMVVFREAVGGLWWVGAAMMGTGCIIVGMREEGSGGS